MTIQDAITAVLFILLIIGILLVWKQVFALDNRVDGLSKRLEQAEKNLKLHSLAINMFEEETQAVTKRHQERKEIQKRFTREPRM